MSDPFEESAAEAKGFLEQARAALRRVKQSAEQLKEAESAGSSADAMFQRKRRAAAECREALSQAREELSLLRSVVDAIKSGRSRTIPHEVLSQREDFVDETEANVDTLARQLDALHPVSLDEAADRAAAEALARPPSSSSSAGASRSSRRSSDRSNRRGDEDGGGGTDEDDDALDFFERELAQQRREKQRHGESLVRISAGVDGLKNKAENISGRLKEDAQELDALTSDIAAVQVRLKSAINKVDSMLEKMSFKSRCSLLLGLVVLAIILLFLLTM